MNKLELLGNAISCLLTNGLPERNEMSRSYTYIDHQIQLRVCIAFLLKFHAAAGCRCRPFASASLIALDINM